MAAKKRQTKVAKEREYHLELLVEAAAKMQEAHRDMAYMAKLVPQAWAIAVTNSLAEAREKKLIEARWKTHEDRRDANALKLKAAMAPEEWNEFNRVYTNRCYGGEYVTKRQVLLQVLGTLRGATILQEALGDAEATEF